MANWSFLTNHGRALLCITQNPDVRLREIASELGITERHAYAIVADLTDAGYVVKEKEGAAIDIKCRVTWLCLTSRP